MTASEYLKLYPDSNYAVALATCDDSSSLRGGLIQFTEATAHNWTGPFEGNYAAYMVTDCRIAPHYKLTTVEDQHQSYLKIVSGCKKRHNSPPWRPCGPSIEFPICLGVYGNDDTSYSCFFSSIEKTLDMVELLEANQPLDFNRDFLPLGFVFTN